LVVLAFYGNVGPYAMTESIPGFQRQQCLVRLVDGAAIAPTGRTRVGLSVLGLVLETFRNAFPAKDVAAFGYNERIPWNRETNDAHELVWNLIGSKGDRHCLCSS